MFGYVLLCVVFNLNKDSDMLVMNWFMDSFINFFNRGPRRVPALLYCFLLVGIQSV